MNPWIWLAAPVLAVACVAAIGLALPASRTGHASLLVEAAPTVVRTTILDVEAQPAWRPDLVGVIRDGREWREQLRSGEQLAFELVAADDRRIHLHFASSRGYRGEWHAHLEPAPHGRGEAGTATLVRVQETATVPNPLVRVIARLAFDPQAFARAYLEQLAAEVARRTTGAGGPR